MFEQEIRADLPVKTQFLSPRLFMNNGATAAAISYDCTGACVQTDCQSRATPHRSST